MCLNVQNQVHYFVAAILLGIPTYRSEILEDLSVQSATSMHMEIHLKIFKHF